jgi:hypothetical protein
VVAARIAGEADSLVTKTSVLSEQIAFVGYESDDIDSVQCVSVGDGPRIFRGTVERDAASPPCDASNMSVKYDSPPGEQAPRRKSW